MPASHEAIGREIQWTGDGRGIDFHVSVGPSGAATISTHQAGFTHRPRGGWVSIWEQFALVVEDLQIKVDRRDRGREPIACTGMPEAPGTPAA